MNNTTGIQAGSLWKLKDDAHLYLTNFHGSCNPLDNPQFKKAFESAHTIAVSYFMESTCPTEGDIALFRQEAIEIETFANFVMEQLPVFAKLMEQHFSLEKIAHLSNKLLKFPLYSHRYLNNFTHVDPSKVCVVRLLRRLAYISLPQKDVNNLMDSILIEEATKSSKKIVSLFTKEEFDFELFYNFESLFETPRFFDLIKIFLFPKDEIEDVKNYAQERGRAWDLGAIAPSIEVPFCSDGRTEELRNQFLKKMGCSEDDLDKIQRKISKHTAKLNLYRSETIAKKIAKVLDQEKSVLFLGSDIRYEDLFSRLSEKNLEPIGPIKEALNPRGFLFEIKKVDRVVGYFLGSIHIIPNWVLESFNTKICEAFAFCNILGVEVDITREDVKQQLGEPEDFSIVKEHAQLLKEVVDIGLKDVEAIVVTDDEEAYIKKGLEVIEKGLQKRYGIESGIDLAFIEKAKKREIKIIDLESIETHKEFGNLMKAEQLNSMSQKMDAKPEEMYMQLKNTIEKDVCGFYPLLFETGYIKGFDKFCHEDSKPIKEAMYGRNMEMVISTHKLIRQGKIPFCIAGAAHFAGDKSMLIMMRDQGYTVTQVICEEPRGV